MQRFISILLLLAVTWQVSGRLQMFVLFKLNQGFIAQNFCENKGNLLRKCNGKCYLTKQMKKETEREQKSAPAGSLQQEILVYFEQSAPKLIHSVTRILFFAQYTCMLTNPIAEDTFRPPAVS